MAILRSLRRIPIVNRITRNILKSIGNLNDKILSHWRISGKVKLNFNNIYFNYYASCDDHIVDLLYYNKNYHETGELRLFLELSKHCRSIFDIGANTGLYSILTAIGNKSCEIIAFEPHPTNINRLKKNISLNNILNVKIVEKALGNTIGKINFSIPLDDSVADTSSANSEFSRATYEGRIKWKEIEVPQITLDSLCEEDQIKTVDLVKLDVEGYEMEVLQGGTLFFQKFSPVIFCEILLDEKRKEFFDKFLSQNNYQPYLVLNDGLLRLDNGIIKNYDGLNYVFSKNKTPEQFTSFKKMEFLVKSL